VLQAREDAVHSILDEVRCSIVTILTLPCRNTHLATAPCQCDTAPAGAFHPGGGERC